MMAPASGNRRAPEGATGRAAAFEHQFLRHVMGRRDSGVRLDRFAELAAAALPGAAACSIAVHTPAGGTAVGASDATAVKLDRYQCRVGEGPGFPSARGDSVAEVDDVAHDVRWPRFARHAASLGVASALCAGVRDGSGASLVLTFTSPDVGAFRGCGRDDVMAVLREVVLKAEDHGWI